MSTFYPRNRIPLAVGVLLLFGIGACYGQEPDVERVKQRALQECLNNNYQALHAYNPHDLNDRSYFLEGVLLDKDGTDRRSRGLSNFVKQHTATFHTAELPFKSENGTRYNDVFAQCMGFYHSPELNQFITGKLLNP